MHHLVFLAPLSPNSSDLHSFLPGHLPQNLQQLGNYFEQLGNYFNNKATVLNNQATILKNRQRQTFLPLDRPCVIHNITLTMAAQNISTLMTTMNMNIYPFIKNILLLFKRDIFRRSPHNSLDSSDSGKSVKLAEDSDGFTLARASDHCKTFWLSKRYKH